jgi:BirA family transcriptional regulator, biotin operon repressor / biotin---[acetyl-CoA-carboxylase] ligase
MDVRKVPNDLTLFTADSCASSMDLAWQLVPDSKLSDWASVLAASQTSGRGQFKRQWHSPPGNVYGSLRIPQPTPAWRNLTALLSAESMRMVLAALGLTATIKWPNDILVAGKKVCGILVEEKSGIVIAGVGLNLISAPSFNGSDRPQTLTAGCLQEFGVILAPMDIWVRFIREMQSRLAETISKGSPEDFVMGLTTHLAFIGERIVLDAYDGANRPAVLLGLDRNGGIRVQTHKGERVFYSGSIYPAV